MKAASGVAARVGGLGAAIGLQLVAEVAGEAAVEVEGEVGGEGAAAAELALEVVEDRFVADLHPGPRSTRTWRRSTS